ncbi:Uncharacterised protein [Mycobacteroides abscessus subsp. abscessus]|nr:Uncharacterised protein [Mycobacteroides abscessus subsp. abscessus]
MCSELGSGVIWSAVPHTTAVGTAAMTGRPIDSSWCSNAFRKLTTVEIGVF